ncbi:hypothetical protein [Kangiella shandongensis]|uniref:hypothetical protein n=1 Tax=Kangiella shandongensis TaxID=2763258 RepID=UPI001CC08DE3|nr:hypothetical protein [Kangiella shandongensis]
MKKLLKPLLLIIIIICLGVVYYKLKDNGYIKPTNYVTCQSVPMTVVYNDQLTLKASYLLKRCNDTEHLKNVVLIKDKETKTETMVYESLGESSERIYLIWDEYDGLLIATPRANDVVKEKRYQTKYRVEYLPLKKLRTAVGKAYSEYKNSYHFKKKAR